MRRPGWIAVDTFFARVLAGSLLISLPVMVILGLLMFAEVLQATTDSAKTRAKGDAVTGAVRISDWLSEPRTHLAQVARAAASPVGRKGPSGGALATDQDSHWAHYDFACWHALYGEEQEARRLLDRAIELGGDEVREQAAKDPDLESLGGNRMAVMVTAKDPDLESLR